MSEIRLYVTSTEKGAAEILDILSEVFGEEDFAIATTEVDEKKDIWEASVYMMADDEEMVRERVAEGLAQAFPALEIQRKSFRISTGSPNRWKG